MIRAENYEENSRLAAEGSSFDEIRKRIQEKILGEADKSIDKIVKVRDYSPDDAMVLKAAQDLLDRAGFIAPKNVQVGGTVQFKPYSICEEGGE